MSELRTDVYIQMTEDKYRSWVVGLVVVCYSPAGCRVADHRFAAVDHMHLVGLEFVKFREEI